MAYSYTTASIYPKESTAVNFPLSPNGWTGSQKLNSSHNRIPFELPQRFLATGKPTVSNFPTGRTINYNSPYIYTRTSRLTEGVWPVACVKSFRKLVVALRVACRFPFKLAHHISVSVSLSIFISQKSGKFSRVWLPSATHVYFGDEIERPTNNDHVCVEGFCVAFWLTAFVPLLLCFPWQHMWGYGESVRVLCLLIWRIVMMNDGGLIFFDWVAEQESPRIGADMIDWNVRGKVIFFGLAFVFWKVRSSSGVVVILHVFVK